MILNYELAYPLLYLNVSVTLKIVFWEKELFMTQTIMTKTIMVLYGSLIVFFLFKVITNIPG
jgi:hypothetical protein